MEKGRMSDNRTSKKTKKIFGYMMRFDLREGFPLSTTRKMFYKAGVHELIWFIMGDTNNTYLVNNGVHIWDEWALPEAHTVLSQYHYQDRVNLYAEKMGITPDQAFDKFHHLSMEKGFGHVINTLDNEGIPSTYGVEIHKQGDLGPIYGAQWRAWDTGETLPTGERKLVDQLQYVIDTLRTNPNSRRIIVSAWNVKDLPDETKDPYDNVKEGKMALAPCHTIFQFATMPMSVQERLDWAAERYEAEGRDMAQGEESELWRAFYETYVEGSATPEQEQALTDELDRLNVPKYMLNLLLFQRSGDAYLGVPTNIMSYALLLSMVAHVTNMVACDFVHILGDAHLYDNQFDNVAKVLEREPLPLPSLWLNPAVKEINDFTYDDIQIIGYQSHGALERVEVAR